MAAGPAGFGRGADCGAAWRGPAAAWTRRSASSINRAKRPSWSGRDRRAPGGVVDPAPHRVERGRRVTADLAPIKGPAVHRALDEHGARAMIDDRDEPGSDLGIGGASLERRETGRLMGHRPGTFDGAGHLDHGSEPRAVSCCADADHVPGRSIPRCEQDADLGSGGSRSAGRRPAGQHGDRTGAPAGQPQAYGDGRQAGAPPAALPAQDECGGPGRVSPHDGPATVEAGLVPVHGHVGPSAAPQRVEGAGSLPAA